METKKQRKTSKKRWSSENTGVLTLNLSSFAFCSLRVRGAFARASHSSPKPCKRASSVIVIIRFRVLKKNPHGPRLRVKQGA